MKNIILADSLSDDDSIFRILTKEEKQTIIDAIRNNSLDSETIALLIANELMDEDLILGALNDPNIFDVCKTKAVEYKNKFSKEDLYKGLKRKLYGKKHGGRLLIDFDFGNDEDEEENNPFKRPADRGWRKNNPEYNKKLFVKEFYNFFKSIKNLLKDLLHTYKFIFKDKDKMEQVGTEYQKHIKELFGSADVMAYKIDKLAHTVSRNRRGILFVTACTSEVHRISFEVKRNINEKTYAYVLRKIKEVFSSFVKIMFFVASDFSITYYDKNFKMPSESILNNSISKSERDIRNNLTKMENDYRRHVSYLNFGPGKFSGAAFNYNPLFQKPTCLGPGPRSGFHYFGPPPDAGTTYGSCVDSEGNTFVFPYDFEKEDDEVNSDNLFRSPITGEILENINRVPNKVKKLLIKNSSKLSELPVCNSCGKSFVSSMIGKDNENIYCPGCGKKLETKVYAKSSKGHPTIIKKLDDLFKKKKLYPHKEEFLEVFESLQNGYNKLKEDFDNENFKEGLENFNSLLDSSLSKLKDLKFSSKRLKKGLFDSIDITSMKIKALVDNLDNLKAAKDLQFQYFDVLKSLRKVFIFIVKEGSMKLGKKKKKISSSFAEATNMSKKTNRILEALADVDGSLADDLELALAEDELSDDEAESEEDEDILSDEDLDEALSALDDEEDEDAESEDEEEEDEEAESDDDEDILSDEDLDEALSALDDEDEEADSDDEEDEDAESEDDEDVLSDEDLDEALSALDDEDEDAESEDEEEDDEADSDDDILSDEDLDEALSALDDEDEEADSEDEEEDEEAESEEDEEEAKAAQYEVLQSVDNFTDLTTADVNMTLFDEDSRNPYWNIDIRGQPTARVYLQDQAKPEAFRNAFCNAAYAEGVMGGIEKIGAKEILKQIKAKYFANKIYESDLANNIRAEFEERRVKDTNKVSAKFCEDLLNNIQIVCAGMDKNFYKDIGNPLKESLYVHIKNAGVRDPVSLIEAAFRESAPEYFKTVLSKAVEYMNNTPQALAEIKKAIAGADVIRAEDVKDEEEEDEAESCEDSTEAPTLHARLAQANFPVRNLESMNSADYDEYKMNLAKELSFGRR